MNNKGQSILSEYVMSIFLVIAGLVAITVFVQRAFEARIHDARNFAVESIKNSDVCDANCLKATGGKIAYEYEPYYSQILTDVIQNAQDASSTTKGSPAAIGAVYSKSFNQNTTVISTSVQLPPKCTDGSC